MPVTDKTTLKTRLVDGHHLDGSDMADIVDSYSDYLSVVGATYAATVLAESGLVSYWKLDENAGASSWADSKGSNTLTATGSNVTSGTPGPFGLKTAPCVAFNGTAGVLNNVSATGIPTGNSSRSVELWFKGGRNATANDLFVYGPPAGASCFIVRAPASTDTVGLLTSGNDFTTAERVTDGSWHHIVITYNSSGNAVKVYVDGILVGSSTLSTLTTSIDANGVQIGGWVPGGTTTRGRIAHVAVYSVVLSAAQVADHYARGVQAGF